jgi:hypothetical protein
MTKNPRRGDLPIAERVDLVFVDGERAQPGGTKGQRSAAAASGKSFAAKQALRVLRAPQVASTREVGYGFPKRLGLASNF